MKMCEACEKMPVGRTGVPGHAALQREGPRDIIPVPENTQREGSYVCLNCFARWAYHADPAGLIVGWHRVST